MSASTTIPFDLRSFADSTPAHVETVKTVSRKLTLRT